MRHRLTRLRVQGMRTLADIDLDLDGLRVLIGENGSGKSSVLEALELLRRAAGSEFIREFNQIHGGVQALRRHDASAIRIGCTMRPAEGEDRRDIEYEIAFSDRGVETEFARASPWPDQQSPLKLFDRSADALRVYRPSARSTKGGILERATLATDRTAISVFGYPPGHPRLHDLKNALESIQVHLPFDSLPSWAANAHGRPQGVRGSVTIAPAARLERLGLNLANVYQTLRNERSAGHWDTTMSWVQLGLDTWIESVTVRADAAGGNVGLWVKCTGVDVHLPARALSDGQLQFLGIVALCRLASEAAIVAFDEPEAHLHPRLQDRAGQMFQRLAETCPVLLATHSRRILDALDEPAKAVRVCAVSGSPGATTICDLDPAALDDWMKEYDGYGKLLDAGYGDLVVREDPPADRPT